MRPINYFMVPVGMLTAISAYYSFQYGSPYTWGLAIGVLLLAVLYIFTAQINWWYWQRRAPDLPAGLQRLFRERFPFYAHLDPIQQREFRRRVFLFQEAIDLKGQGIEEIPDDMKTLAAISAVRVGFGQSDFLLEPFETIVFYPHPFPSPEIERLHTSELYAPDGVLIFSMEHFARSVLDERSFLSLGLYEYSRVYRMVHQRTAHSALNWASIETISGFTQASIEDFIGLNEAHGLDRVAITATLFFSFPERFRQQHPDEFQELLQFYEQESLHLT